MLWEDFGPGLLVVVENERDELDERALGVIASRIWLTDGGRRTSAAATEKSEKVLLKDQTEDQQNQRAADADVHAAELESAATATLVATILDVLAITTGRPSHGCSPVPRMRDGSIRNRRSGRVLC